MPYTNYLPGSLATLEEREKHDNRNAFACTVLQFNAFKQLTGKPSLVEETPEAVGSTIDLTKDPTNIQPDVEVRRHHPPLNCDSLLKVLHPNISNERPFFHIHIKGFNAERPNFDTLGVLYQLNDVYFTICECENDSAADGLAIVRYLWMRASSIGKYIMEEWHVLPKQKVGDFGMGVASEWGTGVHSHSMMQVRRLCLEKARSVKESVENGTIAPESFQYTLTQALRCIVKMCFDTTRETKRQEEETMSLFINFDMCEG